MSPKRPEEDEPRRRGHDRADEEPDQETYQNPENPEEVQPTETTPQSSELEGIDIGDEVDLWV